MALKIATRPTFRHKITARVPIDGGYRDEVFQVTYRLASVPAADLSTDPLTQDHLRDIIVEIDDLVDEAGNALPWSDEVFEAVLNLPWARLAMLRGYYEAVAGARLGN